MKNMFFETTFKCFLRTNSLIESIRTKIKFEGTLVSEGVEGGWLFIPKR